MKHETELAYTLSDEILVEKILEGETHLYEKIIRKFNQKLYRISKSIVEDDQEVEDVMQISYLNAYRQLASFKHQSSFGTWLTRILINESLLHKKRQLRLKQIHMETTFSDHHDETPLDYTLNNELKNILEEAISRLPEKYRIVFVMREVEGMSTSETMETLELGESNVKVRLTRAKEMLRSELKNYWKPQQLYEFNLIRCDVIVKNVMEQIAADSLKN